MTTSNTEKKIKLSENVEAYLYTPTSSYKGGIVFCTDIFGIEQEGTRARAASFAANGYVCVLPDILGNDALTHEQLMQANDALPKWLARHFPTGEEAQTALGLSVSHLEQNFSLKNSAIFMVGVCYGGKALLHALSTLPLREKLSGGMVAHGSFMQPSDIDEIEAPLLLLWAEKDNYFDYKPFVEGINKLQATRKVEGRPPLCGAEDRFKLDIVQEAQHGFWVKSAIEETMQTYASKQMFQWLSKFIAL
ncbi:hypothetical protein IE077_002467 [Cardiosporidium cionae]|uniref:Dienelactone hydrolase domain-containing protein n=1 Tax=Cardiosporidium cionae TaxID=476202 RepID=A0ABQ7JAT8_9APIC|nr:hypothetical protein IE077_002467 [Cardiosporidium cionae]|eukprot:KAF8821094.1 hypothetical protein IE077_002467 [Cardiosporidium cionae]